MSNRVAFVTGGAQGIGQGISETLGANGFRVAVADLKPGRGRKSPPSASPDAGGGAIAVHVDVTDTESVRGAVKNRGRRARGHRDCRQQCRLGRLHAVPENLRGFLGQDP